MHFTRKTLADRPTIFLLLLLFGSRIMERVQIIMVLVVLYGFLGAFASTEEWDSKNDIDLGPVDHQCSVQYPYVSEEHELYCELYYDCSRINETHLHQCSGDFLYQATIHGCGPKEYIDCGNRLRPFNCTSPNGTFPISPDACDSKYYVCVNDEHALQVCPNGTIFDALAGNCSETLNCLTTTTPSATTTSSAKTTSSVPTTPGPFKCPTSTGNFPSPYSCTQYYTCFENIPYLRECPDGLYYNPLLEVCDWPENVPCQRGMKHVRN